MCFDSGEGFPRMKLHPFTQLLFTAMLGIVVVVSGTVWGLAVLLLWCVFTLVVPRRTEVRLTVAFLRLLVVAAGFLLVIHGIEWPAFRLSAKGVLMALDHFRHIAVPIASIMYLSKVIRAEEMFAFLIDLRIPPALILIIFRTLWLVPQFMKRIDDVIMAQRLRGMRIEGVWARMKALQPTLGPVFSSMLVEISDNALVMNARGFMQPGHKTHLTRLRFGLIDRSICFITLTVMLLICLF